MSKATETAAPAIAYKKAAQITFNTLKVNVGEELHVQILGIETKPDIDMVTKKPQKDDDGKDKTITIIRVLNLDDGKKYELVGGKVLVEEMTKAGIKDGDAISILKIDKREGKRYYTFELFKLEIDKKA